MGKKRAAAAAPVFPFPADHFSDYGFDPLLVHRFSQPETKRPSTRRRQQQPPPPPPPVESARFQLQKPISKKHHHKGQQQRRRRWWSSAASAAAALLLFKRPPSDPSPTAGAASPAAAPAAAGPLYFADDDGDATAACACWAPAMRSGRLAAAELGAASASVPYVSLRDAELGRGASRRGAAPAMPIYLVT